jgi:hypothetical protein
MSDLQEPRILRAEATLLRLPVFALAIKGSASLDGFEFRRIGRRDGQVVESVIRTERDDQAAYPGPLSRRVHMALLDLVADRESPFENPLTWTWRDLCRRMGLPASGRRDAELKTALRATWGLKIFGLKSKEGRDRETWRGLYAQCEFLNETNPDGTTCSANRLWLSPWYLESLNAFHSAPIVYELWKKLDRIGPLASRLYEFLVPSFYKHETLELAYDRLALAMPVVVETRRSHAIRQFAPALDAAVENGLVAGFAWDAMKTTGRPKLILDRGKRLAPPESSKTENAAEATPTLVIDPSVPKRFAAEFYRLMGTPDTNPLRSDLALAGSLIAQHGTERAFAILPTAVRLLKARFRNAETMGALVRYVEEAVREQDKRQDDSEREKTARVAKAKRETSEVEADVKRKALWDALPEAQRAALRAQVLIERPALKRFPSMIEARCIANLSESLESASG